MKIKEITNELERFAPLSVQEDYDNSGLIIGDFNKDIQKALICLDVTEDIMEEAIQGNYELIIAHHPIIFKGLKKINGKNFVERLVLTAIKNDIAIYAFHTNADNVLAGVNGIIAEKLGLSNVEILQPKRKILRKLVTFCPEQMAEKVRNTLFEAGAGEYRNYDHCSFNVTGEGTFRGNDSSTPYVGEKGEMHFEKEIRIEVIFPDYLENRILQSLISAHPYEEVAYDIYPIENQIADIGAGAIGELASKMNEDDFLKMLKKVFGTQTIKHSGFLNNPIKKVALCGGAGSFLIHQSKLKKADIFITGDLKYHDFFEASNQILLADIGHYESEQFTKELIYSILNKKFPTFALRISENKTNPVYYF